MKQQDIFSENWKVLIILDACRYDYFEKNYSKFLKGRLEKRLSRGTHTLEWLQKTFTKKHYDDIVYISANPYVKSKSMKRERFLSWKKFHRVIDVWDFGWDEKIQAVRPIEVNKSFFVARYLPKYYNKRFILHYMQPHHPYISMSIRDKNSRITSKYKTFPLFRYLLKRAGELLNEQLKIMNIRKIRRMLNKPSDQMGYIVNKYGVEKLLEEYEKNLILVLQRVSEILPKIGGKVIITSDHGDLLGEHGLFGHSAFKPYKELLEVPYFKPKI